MKISRLLSLLFLSITLLSMAPVRAESKSPYRVYVMLGFHTSFYHSWRGDSNDEAGFGTDIRVVRGILKQLNDADAKGLDARGYWDFDEYFTLEKILPQYAPDIIDGIKARVDSGRDEVLPGPYNNGILSAHTPDELYKTVAWALKNPNGSGLEQVFGKVTPIFRPQEAMSTPGIIPIMKSAGIEGIILPYSAMPFTAFSNFIAPLTEEQRYGPLWLRHETGPEKTILLPCYSPADAVNFGSLELWMRHLRKLQENGTIKSDLLIHYNFDADAETWLPMQLPGGLKNVPNTGGLTEIIAAVNKYDWAKFTTPAEYLKNHQPTTEVVIRQDTADGAFDGYYSWAEKFESHATWTAIEQSRMYSYRADTNNPDAQQTKSLWGDHSSSFWYRLMGLSTTHFGMSTPIINEERQAAATEISDIAQRFAFQVYREIERKLAQAASNSDAEYAFTVYNYPRSRDGVGEASRAIVRVPLILKKPGVPELKDTLGAAIQASLINVENLPDGTISAELTFVAEMSATQSISYNLNIISPPPENENPTVTPLVGKDISLALSGQSGVESLSYRGQSWGGPDFLDPFVTYQTNKKPERYGANQYLIEAPKNEYLDGMRRLKMFAEIPFKTPHGTFITKCAYTFSVYNNLPYVVVDVDVDYPYTPPEDLIATIQQKLRRLLDLRWREVGPFPIHPDIHAPESAPLTIWKHNYLGITSSYSLDYGRINPKNREVDSFNHQVTNGWVAVTNGKKGLLIAEDASVNALFAFAPMRLRVRKDQQRLWINPFGTYFGKQFDYTHLDKSKAAAQMTLAVGAHLRPAGPSFNGKREKFRLLLAPYEGNEPPSELQNDAMAFFYPYAIRFTKTPMAMDGIVVPEDVQNGIDVMKLETRMESDEPLPLPGAILANPAEGAIDLVWDIPRDERITGFDIRWKALSDPGWKETRIGLDRRYRVPDLTDGQIYIFSVRSVSRDRTGDWSVNLEGTPGKVGEVKITKAGNISVSLMLKLAGKIMKHMILIH